MEPSQRAGALASQEDADDVAHAPTAADPGAPTHSRPLLAHSTRTSWPLWHPTAVLPSHFLVALLHALPVVAQPGPSAVVSQRSPSAPQSRLSSLPLSHWRIFVPDAEQARGVSVSQTPSVQTACP